LNYALVGYILGMNCKAPLEKNPDNSNHTNYMISMSYGFCREKSSYVTWGYYI